MQRFYLIPIEMISGTRGPKYFSFLPGPPDPTKITSGFSLMDYGFTPYGLVLAKEISQTDHDALILNSDVYLFPENLDQPVSDPNIDTFFEAIHLPTDWLTPSTTYRELTRQTAGMFLFNQRYGGIAAEQTGELHSVFDTATLDTRLRQMTDQEQAWFLETVEWFGFDSSVISDNSRLRQLVKQAGTFWEGQRIVMGGVEI